MIRARPRQAMTILVAALVSLSMGGSGQPGWAGDMPPAAANPGPHTVAAPARHPASPKTRKDGQGKTPSNSAFSPAMRSANAIEGALARPRDGSPSRPVSADRGGRQGEDAAWTKPVLAAVSGIPAVAVSMMPAGAPAPSSPAAPAELTGAVTTMIAPQSAPLALSRAATTGGEETAGIRGGDTLSATRGRAMPTAAGTATSSDEAGATAAGMLARAWQGQPGAEKDGAGPVVVGVPDGPPALSGDQAGLGLRGLAIDALPSDGDDAADHGRRLIALGLGVEAQDVLDRADGSAEGVAILKAAAAYLANRPAAMALFNAGFDADPEIVLWRVLAAQRFGHPIALDAARQAGTVLMAYPRELARRLLPAIEAVMLDLAAVQDAVHLVDLAHREMPDLAALPSLALPEGRIWLAAKAYDKAALAFDMAVRSGDVALMVGANKYLVDLAVGRGTMPPAAAAAALERQRPLWRGRPDETAFLATLADLRGRAGDLDGELLTLREIAELAPDRAGREAALAASRDRLLRAVDAHRPGARLRLMAFVRAQPALSGSAGSGSGSAGSGDDASRVRAIAEAETREMGLLPPSPSALESAEQRGAQARMADLPVSSGPAGDSVTPSTEKPAGATPASSIAGTPEAVDAALAREIAAARTLLAGPPIER